MNLKFWPSVLIITILLISTFITPSCSKSNISLKGWVFAEEPVIDATISIYTESGKLIKQVEQATNGNGTFIIELSSLPADFNVIASNGLHNSELLGCNLKASFEDFDPDVDFVYINPVTTIVSNYLKNNSDKPLEEANNAVKQMLQIPDYVDPGNGLLTTQEYFNNSNLLKAAEKNGGLDSYLVQLAGQVDGDHFYSFADQGLNFWMIAGEFIAKNLASGMISYIGGKAAGSALDALGFGSGPTPVDTEILNQLNEINTKLDNLSNQMTNLQNQLKSTEYNLRVKDLNILLSTIKTTSERLNFIASLPLTPENTEFIKSEAAAIKQIISTNIMTQTNQIHDELVGTITTTGLIKLWSQIYITQHRYFGAADSANLKAHLDYFNYMQAVQLELIIEYYHSIGAPNKLMQDTIDNYSKNSEQEYNLLPPAVPEGTYVVTPNPYKDPSTPDLMFAPFTILPTKVWCYGEGYQVYNRISVINEGKVIGGFSDWRYAFSTDGVNKRNKDLEAIFFHDDLNISAAEFAASQGWPHAEELSLTQSPGGAGLIIIGYNPQLGAILEGGYFDFKKTGTRAWSYEGGLCVYAAPYQGQLTGYFLPIRNLVQGEWYFYK